MYSALLSHIIILVWWVPQRVKIFSPAYLLSWLQHQQQSAKLFQGHFSSNSNFPNTPFCIFCGCTLFSKGLWLPPLKAIQYFAPFAKRNHHGLDKVALIYHLYAPLGTRERCVPVQIQLDLWNRDVMRKFICRCVCVFGKSLEIVW